MLNNLIVVISGGAGRIGSAFSRVVVENGGKVIIGDMNSELGNRLVADLGENDALFFDGNLTEPNTINNMLEKGLEKFGRIDAGVHCAYPVSKQWGTRFEDLEPEGLEKDFFNQLGGAILFSQQMIRRCYQLKQVTGGSQTRREVEQTTQLCFSGTKLTENIL